MSSSNKAKREGRTLQMKLTIKQINRSFSNTVKVPHLLYEYINTPETLLLTFGKHSVSVSIERGMNELEIDEQVSTTLYIPFEVHSIQARYDERKNEIILGPIVALLTTENHFANEIHHGTTPSFFKEMARYCSQNGIYFYVLPVQPLDKQQPLYGYRWMDDRWQKEIMPLPNVVYNRIPSYRQENNSEATSLFQLLQQHNIAIFNERFLNKWEVYKAFINDPVLAPHLPKTCIYEKASDLDTMLQNFATIYVKPVSGSLGRGVAKLSQTNDGMYTIHHSYQSEQQQTKHRLLSLLRAIIPLLKRQPYLIQQGIQPLTYNRKAIDFRVLCNKNRFGEWSVTSIVGRCSAYERIVSNIAMGGSLHRPEHILATHFQKHERIAILQLLVKLALQCAKTLEQHFEGTFGEFGVDLIVDEEGKPWILEVNTKPSKTEDSTMKTNAYTIRPSTKILIQYATFLSGFEFK